MTCSALLLATASPLRAETVTVVGPSALNGADGANGIPGQPGQNGGPGGAATALADAVNQDNIAEATGSRGGKGGAGGDATIGSGADGGRGGNGGMGGNAIATATTLARDSARAVATGGFGGSPGARGNGSLPGMDGLPGDFGAQGDATARASIDRESLILGLSSGIQGDAIANGNIASASVSGIVGGMADPTASHRLDATATSFSGNAAADAMGRTNHGAMVVRATADIDGRGSDATTNVSATATGTHSGAGSLDVSARSIIENISGGLPANVGHASASGIATGGADVNVNATVVGGAGIELRNAVSGSTSGVLNLSQAAHTVSPRFFRPSAHGIGAVRTDLVAENPGGGDLAIGIDTTALLVSVPGVSDSGDIILGNVQGTSNSGANVTVHVAARGNRILQQDLDDAALPSQIRGVSNGGDVSVSADFTTDFSRASTGPVVVGTEVIGLDGSNIVIDQGLAGDTTGNLELIVTGHAGGGGTVDLAPVVAPPGATYRAGDGGDFITRLTQSGSYTSLSMNATSLAGLGGNNRVPSSMTQAGRGGSATTVLDGTNDAGNVTLIGNARGSRGGEAFNRTGQGGDAAIDFRATTSGDGHAISIGNAQEIQVLPRFKLLRHGAHAEDGGRAAFRPGSPTPFEFGAGGVANSQSNGLALGDSVVTVYDFAGGGSSSGLGGDASSSARAEGGGSSGVLAQSKAAGGFGNNGGGNADSFASASGLGQSDASALAISGGSLGQAGNTHALAEAAGTSGNAKAEARMGGGRGGSFTAMLSRSTASQIRLEATAGIGLALPAPSVANSGSAFLTGRPLAADVDQLVLSHDALANLVTANPGVRVEAVGGWDARGDDTSASTQLIQLDITLDTPASGGDLAMVFSNLDATGGGFETLLFRLETSGTLFGSEVVFNNLADATNFFASLFVLGQTYSGISAIFEVTTLPGQSISLGLAAVVVPEPSTAILLGLGLMLVAGRKHRRCVREAAQGY